MIGWTNINSFVRQNIHFGIKPGVIYLREKHLWNNDLINLESYVTNSELFHDRTETNIKTEIGMLASLSFCRNLLLISIIFRL